LPHAASDLVASRERHYLQIDRIELPLDTFLAFGTTIGGNYNATELYAP
jgi:hypothetical protein